MTVANPYAVPGLTPEMIVGNPAAVQNTDTQAALFMGGHNGDQLVSSVHGKRYASASRGSLFMGNASGKTGFEILAPGGTTSGFVLGNPAGSGVNLELHRMRVIPAGTAATVVIAGLGLEYGACPVSTVYQTTITQMPIAASANTANKARMWDAVTIVANTWLCNLPQFFSSTTNAVAVNYPDIEFDGDMVIPPGIAINLVSVTTQGSILFLIDYVWSEWPI